MFLKCKTLRSALPILFSYFLSFFYSVIQAQTYNYTGNFQTYVVPAGVTQITVDVCGGQGFSNYALTAHGGRGGRVQATIPVIPGETLRIYVGQGGNNTYSNTGGWNGGGNGGTGIASNSYAGGGGGASDIRRSPYGLNDRLVVAAGGGGAGGNRVNGSSAGAAGGGGGGYYGGGGGGAWSNVSAASTGGGGGTQIVGGAGGTSPVNSTYNGTAGTFGQGGVGGNTAGTGQAGSNAAGGAGGAGGGTSGNQGVNGPVNTFCGAGGGGGSSYVIGTGTSVVHTSGFQAGNGMIIITATPTIITGNLDLCIGTTSTLSAGDPVFVEPTGGTKTYVGNDIIHRFTSGGTFNTTQNLSARVLVVGGGGGGGSNGGGGGGAGGVYHNIGLAVTSGNTTVTVGSGGAVHGNTATSPTTGGQSAFGTYTAGGGGGGASRDNGTGGAAGGAGTIQGSGGGGSGASGTPRNSAGGGSFAGGNGTTPDQGCNAAGGGGGGAGSSGSAASNNRGGNGGNGIQNDITGTMLWYAGGGGGGTTNYNVGCGGSGSCNGTACASIINGTGGSGVGGNGESTAGTANTGSGGGAERVGGSGVVIVRYTAPRWSSSDTSVATVDRYTGVVTPVGAGTATITYTNSTGGSISATVTVSAPVGTPSVFGTNTWNVYGYNGQDINLGSGVSYYGYYTQNLGSTTNYGFNTQDVANNGWGNGSRPSASTSWQGCPLPSDDYFTFVHKRRGFPCGRYQLTMIDWDDETVVYVNGTQVWQCVSWYGAGGCANQPAANAPAPIGLFDLDANSTIEVRTGEGVGGAQARLDIVPVVNNLSNNGESRTCPVPANSGWQYFTATGSDRLILAVNPNTQNLGNVTAISYVSGSPINIVDCAKPTVAAYDRVSMGRRWRITATTPPAGNVNIRLYFSNTEFSQHQAAANANTNPVDDIPGLASLKLTKYSGSNEDGVFGNNTNTCPTGGAFSTHNQTANGVNPFFVNSSYVEFVVPSFSELWLHGSSVANSPLPVELLYFSGKCENGISTLHWSTLSEQNNAFFIVEKSKDAVNWEYVDRVSGAGNSNNQLTYNSNDSKNKSGDNYYRLSQQDLDGTIEVLGIVYVSCEKEKENTMLLYPNPASEQVTIDIGAIKNYGASLVRVIDAMGRTIFLDNIEIKEGMQTIFLDVSDYVTGTYFVQLSSSEFVLPTQKLIIRK